MKYYVYELEYPDKIDYIIWRPCYLSLIKHKKKCENVKIIEEVELDETRDSKELYCMKRLILQEYKAKVVETSEAKAKPETKVETKPEPNPYQLIF